MPQTQARKKSIYDVHPGVAMVQDWQAKLPEKTGKTLEQWIELIQKSGPPSEKERRDWLKTEHRLGTNSAWWIAERAEGKGTEADDPEAYLRAAERYVEERWMEGRRPRFDPSMTAC